MAHSLLTVNRLVSSGRLSRRISGTSALVFAPHPDDEVLGCGGTIALKARAGARITVVVMTDGRTSHSALIGEVELVRMRRAEAEDAACRLGLSAGDYEFLEFEDSRLQEHCDAACDLAVQIIEQFRPDEIYVPHRNDGISDHIETNRIVRRAVGRVRRPVMILEYPVWLWNGWPWTQGSTRYSSGFLRRALGTMRDIAQIVFACRARVDVRSVLPLKWAALAAYRSQLQRFKGNPHWPVLSDVSDGEFLKRFETGVEIFRRSDYRP